MNGPLSSPRGSNGLKRRRFMAASAGLAAAGLSASLADPTTAADPAAKTMIDLAVFRTRRIGDKEPLRPDKTALLIIDMINRFCDPRWLSGGSEEGAKRIAADLAVITPNIRAALEAFRKANGLVVHVVNGKWTRDGRDAVRYQRGRDYDLFDTPPMSVIDSLRPRPGEIVIRKVASSAFTGTGLDFLLNNAGIENVVLCGQFGNACVFYSLIQSREYGFTNYWLEDGILYGGEIYRQVFAALAGSMWAKLASSREMVRALTEARNS